MAERERWDKLKMYGLQASMLVVERERWVKLKMYCLQASMLVVLEN
jgi:hypothetical protein